MIAAVLDGAGLSIGKMHLRTLQFAAASTEQQPQERRPSFLSRPSSFLSLTASPASQKAIPGTHVMRIHVDKIVFDASQHMASDGISLTLKKWRQRPTELQTSSGSTGSAEVASTKSWSTPIIPLASPSRHEPPVGDADQLKIFVVGQAFGVKLPSAPVERGLHGSGENDIRSAKPGGPRGFVAVEVWGYAPESRVLPPQTAVDVTESPEKVQSNAHETRKVGFYASADIEERDQDGIFRSVTAKPDGALRLHANQPRRVNIRVTQADQEPFALVSIVSVVLSPPLTVDDRAASLSGLAGGKSSQWLLSPSSKQGQEQQQPSQAAATPTSDPKWHPLEFRTTSEVDSTSRSLSVSVKWDPKQAPRDPERADTAGSRSVCRVVLALTTSWSHVPLVISKSVVTKIAPAAVLTARRFARELEATRMAWWARDPEPPRVLGIEANEAKQEILDDLRDMVVSAVVAGHIRGLLRVESVYELEQVRQQILVMAQSHHVDPPEVDDNGSIGHRDTTEACLTLERVSECLQTLFESDDESEQALEIVQLQGSTGGLQPLYLRRKIQTDLLLSVQHGNVVDLSPAAYGYTATYRGVGSRDDGSEIVPQFVPWRELHFAHFMTEPSHLASGSSGAEMAEFMMLSTATQIDETAMAALRSPRAHSRSKPAKPLKAQWERHWFVLKRPFLCEYMSFALKEELSVIDISKRQLLAPASSNLAERSRQHHSSTSSSSSCLSQAAPSGSGDVLSTIPFSFQLVRRVGSKCVVWTLQTSASPEMRAWLVAIDPLKIEARKAVANPFTGDVVVPAVTA